MYDKLVAIAVLVLVYGLFVSERVHRTTAALLGIVLILGLGVLTIPEAVVYVDWEALGLIFGMFVLVAALTESGFFRWVGAHTLHAAGYRPARMFFLLCGISAVMAAFMDSLTVMIFMGSLVLEACRLLRVAPFPFLLGAITSANIGGSATMVGNPPNVIIGTTLNFGFTDFLVNVGPIALAAFAVNVGFFFLFFRRTGISARRPMRTPAAADGGFDPFTEVKDVRLMRIALMVFAVTVTLLVLHQVLDLMVAFVALLGATLVLIFGGKDMADLVSKVDWHTLLFLGSLFVIVGGLEKTGVLADAANALGGVAGSNPFLLLCLILWMSALLSMVLDNIPFAAAMVPVLRGIATTQGTALPPMVWTLALGANYGGNATPIGASANVVGLAVAEKDGIHVTWKDYMRAALPATVLVVAVANLLLWLRYG